MTKPSKELVDLYRLFSSIDTPQEAEALLQDILTPQELASLAERWQLVRELSVGKPQREIAKKLGVSISKITRGSRVLQEGTGGFDFFIQKVGKRR